MPPAADPQIRTATPADLPALLALEAQFTTDRMSARAFRHHLQNPRADLRVISLDGHIAGYHMVLGRLLSRWVRLYSIAVGVGVRGAGLGRRLLDDAEHRAMAAGRRGITLEVRQDNVAAIALYESAGYRRLKALRRYYTDGADAWRYAKPFPRP
jgi:ribosomal-protein-alanine N-acetyltransferase